MPGQCCLDLQPSGMFRGAAGVLDEEKPQDL